jgi:hypothetical protein
MREVLSWITLSGLVVAHVACTTPSSQQLYPGPARPNSELGLVTVSRALDVTRVDDQEFFSFFQPDGVKELKLLPGMHRITVQFSGAYGTPGEDEEIVRSAEQVIALELAAGEHYRVETSEPTGLSAARAYARKGPALWLVEQSSKQRIELRPDDAGVFWSETQLARARARAAQGDASVVASTGAAPVAGSAPEKSLVLEELERWWGRADQSDRDRFLEQIRPVTH